MVKLSEKLISSVGSILEAGVSDGRKGENLNALSVKQGTPFNEGSKYR